MEDSPCSMLSVKIIQITNLRESDLFSQSACYVTLSLPSASVETARTKTIKHCKNPVWNETFCFRIQNQVKNILELMVHDEDNCLLDGDFLTVLFDVAKLRLGETICLKFPLDPKIQENLEVEFSLESIPVPHENIVTNGVLVSREMSCLELKVNKKKTVKSDSKDEIVFSVPGSYEGSQKLPLTSTLPHTNPLQFHYVKYKESALKVELSKKCCHMCSCFFDGTTDNKVSLTLPLDSVTVEKEITIAKDKSIDLTVKTKDCSKDFDVRLGYELCPDEQVFIQKRKKIVADGLKKFLHMQNDLQDHEVPVVAVMATGGGARAFTALHGHLFALQKLNLLDCLTYIAGSSGSTWTLSNLYERPDWSQQDLSGSIAEARKNMAKCKLNLLTTENLKEYSDAMKQRQKEGYKTCSTDLWGLFIDKALGNGSCSSTLSGQKVALNHGQNPLPIYMVLNTRANYSLQEFKEWMEFTPFEVGLLKYGAYVRAEDFGSKFFMGRMMKKNPESQICFMKGLWSNVFSYNLLDSWRVVFSTEDSFWHRHTRDRVKVIEESPLLSPIPEAVNTCQVIPPCKFLRTLREIITERATTSEVYNFLNGFQLNNGYLKDKNFNIWKDTVLDTLPNQLLTPLEYLSLSDTAVYIDTSYAPLMRPERKVDVIIHLNYSSGSQILVGNTSCKWAFDPNDRAIPNGDKHTLMHFTSLHKHSNIVVLALAFSKLLEITLRPQSWPLDEASIYFAKQGIPFPKIDLTGEEHLKECYVFEDSADSRAPIVIFFPLINDTFRKYKAPGVKRSPTERKQGDVDVTSLLSPYAIQNFEYTEENFDKLIELTSYNILNNKHSIFQALQRAIERKKHQKK